MLHFLGFAESLALFFPLLSLFFPLPPRFFPQALALGVALGTLALTIELLLGLGAVAFGFLLQPLGLFLGLAFFLQADLLRLAGAPLSFLLFLFFRQLSFPLGDPLRRLTIFLFLLGGELARPSSLPIVFELGFLPRAFRQRSGFRLGLFGALLLFCAQGLLLLPLLLAQSFDALCFFFAGGLLTLLLLQALELGALFVALLLLAQCFEAFLLALGLQALLLFVALRLQALFLAVLLLAQSSSLLLLARGFLALALSQLLLCQLRCLARARSRGRHGASRATGRRRLRTPRRLAGACRTFFSRC